MSAGKNEADVILNRTNVALARSQRLVASWLPPRTATEEPANSKTEEELRREEDEMFTAVPERCVVRSFLPVLPRVATDRIRLDWDSAPLYPLKKRMGAGTAASLTPTRNYENNCLAGIIRNWAKSNHRHSERIAQQQSRSENKRTMTTTTTTTTAVTSTRGERR